MNFLQPSSEEEQRRTSRVSCSMRRRFLKSADPPFGGELKGVIR